MRYKSPLRYPGGKGRLAPFIGRIFEMNGLLDGHYVEPYAGGAGVALALLYGEYASKAYINDFDRSVYAFWHAVLHDTEAFCRLVRDRPLTLREWRRQRAVQQQPEAPLLELGFSTFFLNRTNRSGIITGGVIGGKGQQGAWSLDARFNRAGLVERIEKVARYRDRLIISNEDAVPLLRRLLPSLGQRVLVYLDPPYLVPGRQRLYANFYSDDDHAQVARLVRNLSQPWIVSYGDEPEIRRLYRGCPRRVYSLDYSAQARYAGREVMFFSDRLKIPRVADPSRIAQEPPARRRAEPGPRNTTRDPS